MIGDIGFILMEKIPGVPLSKCWGDLPQSSMETITAQLRDYIQQWRKIEGTFFGTVDGGPCEDVIFKHPREQTTYQYGPYQIRAEFNQGVVGALRNSRPNRKLTNNDGVLVEKLLASGDNSQDGKKIFTHGDLHQSNIIVQDNAITGIVDWGVAGYSIPAREYFGLKWTALDENWERLLSTILDDGEYDLLEEVNYSMMVYTCL